MKGRWIIATAAAAVFLMIALIPTVLSTGLGRSLLENYINEKIDGEFSVESISLSWFGPQKAERAYLQAKKRSLTATADMASTGQSLFTLILFGAEPSDMQLANLNLSFISEGGELIEARNVNGRIDLPEVSLSGQTRQGETDGSFSLEATSGENSRVEANFENFPTAILDLLVEANRPELAGISKALLGKTLNLSIDEARQEGELNAKWSLNSPNVQAKLNLEADPASFWISEPSSINFMLNPEAVKILSGNRFALQREARGSARIDQLEIPLFHPLSHFSCVCKFEISNMALADPDVAFDSLHGSLFVPKTGNTMQLKVEAVGNNLRLMADAETEKPEKGQTILEKLIQKTKIHVEAANFPTEIFGEEYEKFAGASLNGALEINVENRKGSASLQLNSEKIELSEAEFEIEQNIILKKPFAVRYTLSPALFPELKNPLKTELRFNHLAFPRPVRRYDGTVSPPNPDKVQIDIDLAADEKAEISLQGKNVAISNLKASLAGTTLYDLRYLAEAEILTDESALLGDDLFVKGSGRLSLFPSGIQFPDIHIEAKSSKMELSLRGRYMDDILFLTSPARLVYTATPEFFDSVKPKGVPGVLKAPSQWEMTVTPTAVPLNRGELADYLDLKGQIRCDALVMSIDQKLLSLKQLVIPWEIDGSEKRVDLSASGKTFYESETGEGSFNGKAVLKNWSELESGRASLVNFPIALLNLTTGQNEWTTLLGNSVDAEVDSVFNKTGELERIELSLHGNALNIEGAFKIEDALTLYDSDNPAKISLELTKERFEALAFWLSGNPNRRISLTKTAEVKGAITHLRLPLQEPYWKAGLDAKISVEQFEAVDRIQNEKLSLSKISAYCSTKELSKKVSFGAEALPNGLFNSKGSLHISGVVEDAFTEKGELNTQALSCDLAAKAEEFQTQLFCTLFCPYPALPHKIEALLGDPINADVKVKLNRMSGPLEAELAGTNGTLQLKGKIGGGVLTLDEPLLAQVRATPELGQYVLKDIAPFLSGLKSAENSLRIAFGEKGFSFPAHDFSLEKIVIPNAFIDMGKMQFANRAQIATILGLLGAGGEGANVNVWLTPLYFSMQNGIVKLERVDMLLENQFPIAAWGTVDLLRNQVNMVIGIRGFALLNAFQIKGLTPDAMIQMSLKGPIDNPKIDRAQIAAKISSLIAQTQGSKGELLGSLIDLASGLTQSKVPPPTTNPLPWEEEMPELKPEAQQRKEKSPTQKELEKAGKSLIKNLFGK